MSRCRLSLVALSLVMVVAVPPARADAPTGADGAIAPSASAESMAEEGTRLFRAGRFGEAREQFRRAYALDRHPLLVYNVARASESMGDVDAAIAAFREYLEVSPDATDRLAVEQRIASLTAERDRQKKLEADRDRALTEARRAKAREAEERSSPSPVPWIFVGVGTAAVGTGIALGVVAEDRYDAALDPLANGRDAGSALDDARAFGWGANLTIPVGGAALLSGLVWGIVDVATSGSDAVTSERGRLVVRF